MAEVQLQQGGELAQLARVHPADVVAGQVELGEGGLGRGGERQETPAGAVGGRGGAGAEEWRAQPRPRPRPGQQHQQEQDQPGLAQLLAGWVAPGFLFEFLPVPAPAPVLTQGPAPTLGLALARARALVTHCDSEIGVSGHSGWLWRAGVCVTSSPPCSDQSGITADGVSWD